jgi:hypothetical protein
MTRRTIRADGWTAGRQARFLAAFADTRSVVAAARVVGMSRESAYRLRGRPGGLLFAHLWDLALATVVPSGKGDTGPLATAGFFACSAIIIGGKAEILPPWERQRTARCPAIGRGLCDLQALTLSTLTSPSSSPSQ